MQNSYKNSHKHPAKGKKYDTMYSESWRASLLWSLEKKALDIILKQYYTDRPIELMDFACGTGRIIQYLEEKTVMSVGVDVSESMIHEALRKVKKSKIICADLTVDHPFPGRSFNLITSFRFFLNAETTLRLDAMKALVALLKDDGYLVFNNHRNRLSLGGFILKILNRRNGVNLKSMSMGEMEDLVKQCGLEIVDVFHCGIIPSGDHRTPLPRRWVEGLENFAFNHHVFAGVSEDIVMVCRKKALY